MKQYHARYTHCCSASSRSQTSRPEEPLTNAEHKRLSSLLATDRHFMTLEISAGQSAFSHLARHSAATCPTSCCGLTTMVDDQFFFPHTHFVHFLVDLLWTRPRTTTISFVRHSLQRCRRRRTWAVFWIAVGGSSPGAHNRDLDERARSNQVEELRKLSLANRVFIYTRCKQPGDLFFFLSSRFTTHSLMILGGVPPNTPSHWRSKLTILAGIAAGLGYRFGLRYC